MHVWKKRVPLAAAEDYAGTLANVVDPARLVVVEPPGKSYSRIEVYLETEPEAHALKQQFGGQVSEVYPESWQPSPVTAPGKPLSIGGRLLVTSREAELPLLREAHPAKHVLCIPAAMAFGTGEHATTAMCLRLLLEVSRRRESSGWDLLDLGMGSGILALAGKMFGARQAFGIDNDPHAVRTAKENAQLNGLAGPTVRFAQIELPRWPSRPDKVWPVVTANLFSELLIRLMPAIIAPSVAPGGDLIVSGVLATQAEEVVAAFERSRLTLLTTKSRGRWRAFHCRQAVA